MHDADFIIDPSISANSTLRAQVNSNTKFFTGPKWLLLREEFEKHHAEATARKNFQKVFVFFGGTDPKKLSIPYIRAMQEMEADLSGLNLKIIVSPHQANADDILKMR
jgi:spore coat polysaccharide biosynthesis predicted glycosyltransferase SpsG